MIINTCFIRMENHVVGIKIVMQSIALLKNAARTKLVKLVKRINIVMKSIATLLENAASTTLVKLVNKVKTASRAYVTMKYVLEKNPDL